MSQPIVDVRVADAKFVFSWMKKLFYELRLLRSNKITLELIENETEKPFIRVTRRG